MVPSGTRAGRVKVVFMLPRTLDIFGPQPAPAAWPRGPLAYIEWYTPLRRAPNGAHSFYKVARMPSSGQNALVPGGHRPFGKYSSDMRVGASVWWMPRHCLAAGMDFGERARQGRGLLYQQLAKSLYIQNDLVA